MDCYVIKSFKHDGHLHRTWFTNWRVPDKLLHPGHAAAEMLVFVNYQTRIQEADGKEWISRVPGVSFFIPRQWYNIVALLEETGVRYYCNIASPFYVTEGTLTYIDYDLDVIRLAGGDIQIVDEDEYNKHKHNYHYSTTVEEKVREGMEALLERMRCGEPPFRDDEVLYYFELWKSSQAEVGS